MHFYQIGIFNLSTYSVLTLHMLTHDLVEHTLIDATLKPKHFFPQKQCERDKNRKSIVNWSSKHCAIISGFIGVVEREISLFPQHRQEYMGSSAVDCYRLVLKSNMGEMKNKQISFKNWFLCSPVMSPLMLYVHRILSSGRSNNAPRPESEISWATQMS